ncbi:replication-associated recombination protein A [Georgenia satyanarayanai]|uniref:replication-associated recombination protein A n=1 Tax=Georgenia satyanarayanai TaxID=860221 RepID=UPI00126515AA|nr:replication-associated recombination protein A [Georgenia satyanarayanai]
MDLFDSVGADDAGTPAARPDAPLAVRMRPASLAEVVGQEHLLKPGAPLRRLVEPGGSSRASSVILWGPPGTGKTTLAYLVAHASGRRFVELSAVTAGVKDVRQVVEDARRRLVSTGGETVLFIDEVHRFSKTQQDALLPSVENGWVTLVAATTENPSFSVISPLLSRSLLLTLQPLEEQDIRALVARALEDERGLNGRYELADDALDHLVRLAGADARKALTILEAAAGAADDDGDIDLPTMERAIDVAAVRYDRDGDQHYDVTSAFIKSMRGSDVDAALHYLARMIVAGEDPRFIARRIVIAASEEVGMADPTALHTAVAAAEAVAFIGMPEGGLVLAQAVVHVATAPKSNASYRAIGEAIADVRAGKAGPVPPHLRDSHYAGAKKLGHGTEYVYAHDVPHAIASQQYLPDELVGRRYYEPRPRGLERDIATRLERIRDILGSG